MPPCRLRCDYLETDDQKRHPYIYIGQFARECKHVGVAILRNGEIRRGVWCGDEIGNYSVLSELPDDMAILNCKYPVPTCDIRATSSHIHETKIFETVTVCLAQGNGGEADGIAQQSKSPPSVTRQKGPETIVTPTPLSGSDDMKR